MKSGKNLYDMGIRIEEDYTDKVMQKRKILMPIFHAARKQGIKTNLQYDKLFVNNIRYDCDNLDTLPPSLHPDNVTTFEKDNKIVFFSRLSPFSNHHICEFNIGPNTFDCSKDYFFKDLLF